MVTWHREQTHERTAEAHVATFDDRVASSATDLGLTVRSYAKYWAGYPTCT